MFTPLPHQLESSERWSWSERVTGLPGKQREAVILPRNGLFIELTHWRESLTVLMPLTLQTSFFKKKVVYFRTQARHLVQNTETGTTQEVKKPFCCNSVICFVAIKWECWDFNSTIWFPASTIINFLLFCCNRIKWKLMMWNPVLSRLWWASSTRWGSSSIWQCGRWLQCSLALPGSCAFWRCSAWIRPPKDCSSLPKMF